MAEQTKRRKIIAQKFMEAGQLEKKARREG